MNNKNILFVFVFAFLVLTLTSFALAKVNINYNVYEGIIQDDGTIRQTRTSVNNFTVFGVNCGNQACSITKSGDAIFLAETTVSGNNYTIIYPTSLESQYGYGIFFYKSGYIHWEILAGWRGTNNTIINQDIYLTKKDTCYSPIMNLSVLREVQQHKMITVNAKVKIDADTVAALSKAGPVAITPTKLAPYAKVNTSVTMEVLDHNNHIVDKIIQYYNLDYSEIKNIAFNYQFNDSGEYKVKMYTDVVDVKCINSIRQSAENAVTVIPQNSQNYSYSLLKDVSYSPFFPRINDNVTFNLETLSNYVISDSRPYSVLNTGIVAQIYRNGELIATNNYNVTGTTVTQFNKFSFTRLFSQFGNYNIVITASPLNPKGNMTYTAQQNVSFVINVAPGSGDEIDGDDDPHIDNPNVDDPHIDNNDNNLDISHISYCSRNFQVEEDYFSSIPISPKVIYLNNEEVISNNISSFSILDILIFIFISLIIFILILIIIVFLKR